MKYYRYLKEIEEVQDNTNTNYFIAYTFGGRTNRLNNLGTYGSNDMWYNTGDGIYSLEPQYKKYNFHVSWIYPSADDGITIVDDNNNVHDLEPIRDYFFEVNTSLDAATEELIKLKKEKGAKITIKPLMMDMRSYKIIYHIECSVMTTNGRCFSSTSDEDTDVYNSVVNCFKKLRKGSLNGYYQKIKDILDERIRKHT
jgi:hypothetical protein